MMPIKLGTADFMVHHIHAFTIHVTVLILLKGVLYARSSKLIPDKANLGFRFPCDGPGRGGKHVSLLLGTMFSLVYSGCITSISVVIFHFSWKMQSDVWGTVSPDGFVSHITGGNFAQSSITINGWLRDFLWSEASQVIQSYGSAVSAYGLIFLGAHFIWAFSLMFLFSGRGYWQELIESIVWAHNKIKLGPAIQPRALSITSRTCCWSCSLLIRWYWYNMVVLLSTYCFCRLIFLKGNKNIMATKFPKFSQALAQDPATRRIWYGIATAHDLESHDGMTEESLYQKIFASHFGHLAIIMLWTSGNLFHVAWQGNFEQWILNPLKVKPIAHAIWDPHFGEPALKAFTRGGVNYPVNIAYSGVYHWWYTIGMRTNNDLYFGSIGLLVLASVLLFAGWLHLQPKFKPSLSWFKNNESRLNHHLSGLFGVSSLAWTGHLVHVAIPESRGIHVGWDNFLVTPPHPEGLKPFFSGNWLAYAANPDTPQHVFGTSEGAGTAILTFVGGFNPTTQSLWLTDIAHHQLAIATVFIVAGHMYRTNFGIGHDLKEILDAHRPPGGRLGAGHRGLFDTITNSLHMQLGLALACLGVACSLTAQHMYALPAYAYIAKDYTTQAALYTHHQYIAGFLMVGAFAHGAIFFVRDYDPETNKDNVLARMLEQKEAIISHLSWVSLFLGFHTLGLYVHNDTVVAFGQPEKQILIEPVFAQFIQAASGKALYGFDVLFHRQIVLRLLPVQKFGYQVGLKQLTIMVIHYS